MTRRWSIPLATAGFYGGLGAVILDLRRGDVTTAIWWVGGGVGSALVLALVMLAYRRVVARFLSSVRLRIPGVLAAFGMMSNVDFAELEREFVADRDAGRPSDVDRDAIRWWGRRVSQYAYLLAVPGQGLELWLMTSVFGDPHVLLTIPWRQLEGLALGPSGLEPRNPEAVVIRRYGRPPVRFCPVRWGVIPRPAGAARIVAAIERLIPGDAAGVA